MMIHVRLVEYVISHQRNDHQQSYGAERPREADPIFLLQRMNHPKARIRQCEC